MTQLSLRPDLNPTSQQSDPQFDLCRHVMQVMQRQKLVMHCQVKFCSIDRTSISQLLTKWDEETCVRESTFFFLLFFLLFIFHIFLFTVPFHHFLLFSSFSPFLSPLPFSTIIHFPPPPPSHGIVSLFSLFYPLHFSTIIHFPTSFSHLPHLLSPTVSLYPLFVTIFLFPPSFLFLHLLSPTVSLFSLFYHHLPVSIIIHFPPSPPLHGLSFFFFITFFFPPSFIFLHSFLHGTVSIFSLFIGIFFLPPSSIFSHLLSPTVSLPPFFITFLFPPSSIFLRLSPTFSLFHGLSFLLFFSFHHHPFFSISFLPRNGLSFLPFYHHLFPPLFIFLHLLSSTVSLFSLCYQLLTFTTFIHLFPTVSLYPLSYHHLPFPTIIYFPPPPLSHGLSFSLFYRHLPFSHPHSFSPISSLPRSLFSPYFITIFLFPSSSIFPHLLSPTVSLFLSHFITIFLFPPHSFSPISSLPRSLSPPFKRHIIISTCLRQPRLE
ncbi:hypothetical protein C7M84_015543 [Penaeus vannamei]|uniref:Uncharacterized protein n=1 Tax=Penaeus vannamei TaxID=6689 RepID=A0A3R7Q218_PENVA|nr:hypothetical protein C7M84_015543 [Penaeus vannamei]